MRPLAACHFLLSLLDIESFEKSFLPFEVSLKGREEKTLAKAAGTAEKYEAPNQEKLDIVSFVYVALSIATQRFETLCTER